MSREARQPLAPEAHSCRDVHGTLVYGVDVDSSTRCAHWHLPVDIVAIRFACCDRWYPCAECHAAVADHESTVWPAARFAEPAVLCGACGHQMSVDAYLECDAACPSCSALFNPRCRSHAPRYFEGVTRDD
jgi:uncharacterized CHY-type Zn-finger protein